MSPAGDTDRHRVTHQRPATVALSTPHSQQRVTAKAWSGHDTGVADKPKSRWRRRGTEDVLLELSRTLATHSHTLDGSILMANNVNSSGTALLMAEYLKSTANGTRMKWIITL